LHGADLAVAAGEGRWRHTLEGGHVEVDKIREIGIADISPHLARRSGFDGVIDLLKTAQHGAGTHVYLIDFHFEDAAL
jgi:hypothetical protein